MDIDKAFNWARIAAFAGLMLAMCFALMGEARAQEKPCLPIDGTRASLETNGFRTALLTDPAAIVKATAIYNALPPKDDETFDFVMLALRQDGAIVFFGRNGQICNSLNLGLSQFEKFINAISGIRA